MLLKRKTTFIKIKLSQSILDRQNFKYSLFMLISSGSAQCSNFHIVAFQSVNISLHIGTAISSHWYSYLPMLVQLTAISPCWYSYLLTLVQLSLHIGTAISPHWYSYLLTLVQLSLHIGTVISPHWYSYLPTLVHLSPQPLVSMGLYR